MYKGQLAYWIGVAQTDAYLYRTKDGKKFFVRMTVGQKSLEMLNKFRNYSGLIFDKTPKIYHDKKRNAYMFRMGANKLLKFFEENEIEFSDPPTPPSWILLDNKLIGAYLAGIIDGDGDVRIKRKVYPQCVVRITSGKSPKKLQNLIEKLLKCSTSITKMTRKSSYQGREIFGQYFCLEFYISPKNIEFIEKFIVPYLALDYKRNKIDLFVKNRYAPAGIRNPGP